MGRQSLGLSQQCIKFTSVSITLHLGPIGASYSWKHAPSDGLLLNSAPAYQVLGGKPTATGHGLFCPPVLDGGGRPLGGVPGYSRLLVGSMSTPSPIGRECRKRCRGPGLTVTVPLSLWIFTVHKAWEMSHPPTTQNSHIGGRDERPCWRCPHSFQKELPSKSPPNSSTSSYNTHFLG